MKKNPIYVIVPRLPPSIDGLGDYGYLLAKQIKKDFGLRTHFIVGDPNWIGEETLNFEVSKVAGRDVNSLLKLLPNKGHVLLHYVGYGYAKRGSPSWLIKALEVWTKNSDRKLITMFHECYAFGPIWSSQFWTSPLQRKLVKRLALISHRVLTSKNSYAKIIKNYSGNLHDDLIVIPVFSNVGEPEVVPHLKDRDQVLVVFGSASWRKNAYVKSNRELNRLLEFLKIKKVIDVGTRLDFVPQFDSDIEYISLGQLKAEEVSNVFLTARVGYFNYPTDYLSKSGIFASFCAHGLLPVSALEKSNVDDGALSNEHYISVEELEKNFDENNQQRIASNAFKWYRQHNLETQAKIFLDCLD